MPHVTLPKVGTAEAWREAARACLSARIPPEGITWSRGPTEAVLFTEDEAPPAAKVGAIRVPESFVHLASQVVWHSHPERFARLYAVLWRLRTEPQLMQDAADRDLVALRQMERAVHRDLHKLKAFVRFREVGERAASRRKFAAWFEPAHHTLEPAAPFFARRFADMDWLIATPDLVARFEDGVVTFEEGAERPDLPDDAAEDLWLTYFRHIFNPARVKVDRMLAEMPKKYWKNLPETAAIPDLLQTAESRVRAMAEAAPTRAPFYAKAIAARPKQPAAPPPDSGSLAGLRAEEAACTRCPLFSEATQVVPGEGPPDAPLMLVGEQPGDQEDLAGRPFVGPAGQLLDDIMVQAGIDRRRVFLTNAVKHFKYTLKGRHRLHQSPNGSEISACQWWLRQEIDLVKPRLLVALGASAAESLTGSRDGILKRRGQIEDGPEGLPVFLTVHPSFLLRLPDPVAREMETERFRDDLAAAREHLERLLAA
ncbi:UdgX family uracil-DNA binding protein [Rubellimicrobium roseum]|uniref:Type-4 uracil-DNA glycosylase n=1 Tax=Rubellimicrobium roseum TaxID=687525 RepID=A0A5C4NAV5_9RHOB|nr:UdgX family uracil-DNA binding protein [Rubellimicrobium roseum]TNC69873.1 UdgX family uracil-DNA binding protein [Rubellimicrobium roseum]